MIDVKKGRPFKKRPDISLLRRLYCENGLSIRQISAALGVSKDLIRRALKEAGALDIAGRFVHAGLPAPRQLILDERQDLNEFYNLTKGKP